MRLGTGHHAGGAGRRRHGRVEGQAGRHHAGVKPRRRRRRFGWYGALAQKEIPAKADAAQIPHSKVDNLERLQKDAPIRADLYGDALPNGAMARLGTVRWRHGFQNQWVVFAAGGEVVVSGGMPGGGSFAVGIWDTATGRLLHKFPGHLPSGGHLAVSPDGKLLFTDFQSLLDVATGQEIRRFGPIPGSTFYGAFSPDGQTLAGSKSGTLILWDLKTGAELRKIEGRAVGEGPAAFSPDGKVVALPDDEQSIRLWAVATGAELKRLDSGSDRVWCVAFSPDGKVLASVAFDSPICLWDLETGKRSRQLKTDDGMAQTMAIFSPDGQHLASIGINKVIHLWDPHTGRELRHWPSNGNSLAMAPDGKTLASVGGFNGETVIRRWETATGKEIDPPTGHTAGVNSLLFTRNGSTLICAAEITRLLNGTSRPSV